MAKSKLTQKFKNTINFKRLITHLVLLAFLNQNLAFATNSIIELDFEGSQTPQRLHTLLPSSKIQDVSHIEIDTEQKQATLYKKGDGEEVHPLTPFSLPSVAVYQGDVAHNLWNLEQETIELFLQANSAWLIPLNEDGYKLEFKGRLLGGGGAQSTGGGGGGSSHSSGGGQCRPSVWSECDNRGNCELNITVCNTHNNYSSNDHYISGTSHHGGNDRTGGYGNSGSSGVSSGHGSSNVSIGGYVAPDLSRHPQSTDSTEIAFWRHNIILNYPRDNVMHYLKKNAFIPKDDIKDKLLDDALLQVVLDYNGDMSSPMKILLETLSYMARQDLRNMLNGLERTRDYTVPLSKSDALKRLIIMSNLFIERVSPDAWGVGPGSDCFHWGQLSKINTNSAITKVLVPQLFNKGIDLLKTSGQPVYKGSKYLLTQNAKGNIAMASPYNGLSYPLFAEDRLTGDSYLPHSYVCDPLLDQALWGAVHNYVDGTLSKSLYKTTWKEYRYHTEPAFYVIRTALRDTLEQAVKSDDYTQLALPSSLGQSLQEAVARHIFLTPLFDQDSTLGITQYLTPTLFRKGVEILKKDQQIRNPFFEPYEQFKHIQHLASKEKTWEAVYEYSDPLGYDRDLVHSIDWKSTYTFEKYLQTYNPFYQDYRQIKEIHRLINTVKTYDEVFKYSTPLGYDQEFVKSIEWKEPMPSFSGYMAGDFAGDIAKDILMRVSFPSEVLESLAETFMPGRDLSTLQKDLVHLKEHIVDGILSYGEIWRESGEDLAALLGEHPSLKKVFGETGQTAGIIFGVGMVVPKGLKANPHNPRVFGHKAPPVLQRQPDFKWTVKEPNIADKIGQHPKFGKICRDPSQKVGNKEVWWSKDTAKHGGSNYKLFEEKATHYSWIGDVDANGKVVLKHKSEIGIRIYKNEINWIK